MIGAMRPALLLVVVAACGSNASSGGTDAHALQTCPGQPDAPPYDEDGDGIPDACDPCPIAPPAANADPDGDGIEAACDPESDQPNQILAFAGFRELPQGWTLPAGWTVEGGELVATQPGVSPGIVSIPILGTNHFAIQASYRIDAASPTGNATATVAVAARDKRPAGTVLYECGVTESGGAQAVSVSTDVGTGGAPATGLFDTADLFQVGFLVDGGQAACAVVANANADARKSTSTQDGGNLMTEAGLDVAFATARFQWVMVVGR